MTLRFGWLLWTTTIALALAGCKTKTITPDGPSPCRPEFVASDGACSAGSITGMVTLEGRTDHSGTEVKISGTDRVAVSDAEGRYSFASVQPGSWSIEFLAEGYFPWTQEDVVVAAREETAVDPLGLLATARKVAIQGKVLLAGADAHGSTRITVEGTTSVALTKSDGTFVLGGIGAGSYLVVAEHDGYLRLQGQVTVDGKADVTMDPWTMQPMPAPGIVRGLVTVAGTSSPVAGATVMVSGGASVRTEADGTYALAAPAGAWEIRAGKPGYAAAVEPGVVVFSGLTTDLDLALVPAQGGSAIVGHAYRLGSDAHAGTSVVLTDGENTFETTTGADGRWELIEVPEGLYDLEAKASDLGYEILRGVVVNAGLNLAPDIHLSAAIRIADRNTREAWVLPSSGLALVRFGGEGDNGPADFAASADPEPFIGIFDPRTRNIRVLVEGSFWILAVDPGEQYATVEQDGTFYRLSFADGSLDDLGIDPESHVVSDRGMSLFRQDAGVLVLHAAELTGTPRSTSCGMGWAWIDPLWSNDAYSLITVSNDCGWFQAPADPAQRFVGVFSPTIYANSDGTRWVSLVDGDTGLEAWWMDLESARMHRLPGVVGPRYFDDDGFAYEGQDEDGTVDLHLVDYPTGTVTSVEEILDAAQFGDDAIIWASATGLGWAYLDDRGAGTLCDSVETAASDMETILACADSTGVLRVWMVGEETGAVWSPGAVDVPHAGARFVIWKGMDGTHHMRHADRAETVDLGCTGSVYVTPSQDPDRVVITCATIVAGSTSRALEASSGTLFPLVPYGAAPQTACEFSPGFDAALCYANSEIYEVSVQDLGGQELVDLGSFTTGVSSVWWSEGGTAVGFRAGAGSAVFARKDVDGAWGGAECSSAGYPVSALLVDGVDFSFWLDAGGQAALCSAYGEEIYVGAGWDAAHVPGSSRILHTGGVADLSDGTFAEVAAPLESMVADAAAVYARDWNWDLVRVTASGDPVTIASEVWWIYESHGTIAFMRQEGMGESLWLVEGGTPVRVTEPFIDSAESGDVSLLAGAPGAGWAMPLTILGPDWSTTVVDVALEAGTSIHATDDAFYFQSSDGELVRLDHAGVSVGFGPGSEFVDLGADGSVYFTRDGVVWHEGRGSHVPLFSGDGFWFQSAVGSSSVLESWDPAASFWFEVR